MSIVDKVVGGLFGSKSERDIKEIQPYVDKINAETDRISGMSHDQLRTESAALKQRIRDSIAAEEMEIASLKVQIDDPGMAVEEKERLYLQVEKIEKAVDENIEKALEEGLPLAFAIIKETARRFKENESLEVTANDYDRDLAAARDSIEIKGDKAYWKNEWMAGGNMITWDMVHYDVQLIGGVVLHQGRIAEMATGEGKTLVATLPVYLNALTGRGVHMVTVNDYLAKRDAEWMGPLYEFHGLLVDCIDKHQPNSEDRRKAYRADITFGTNNEFGFDYLRDNMAISAADLVQRPHNFSIVDEVDSVLVDDARTPLIISGPIPRGENQQFMELKPKVEKIINAQRKLVNNIIADARKHLNEGETEKGGLLLLRAFKGLAQEQSHHQDAQ